MRATVVWPRVDGGLEDVELGDEAGGGRQAGEREHADRQRQAVERAAEAEAGDVVERLRIVLVLGQHRDHAERADVHQRVGDGVDRDRGHRFVAQR